jgi:hypothetical protein
MVRRAGIQYPLCVTRRNALNLLRDPCFALLLAATFLARSLIPAGFMPAPQGLVMCSAIVAGDPGATSVATLRSLPTPPMGAGTDPHDPCPFALAMGALADTTATPTLETASGWWKIARPTSMAQALPLPGPPAHSFLAVRPPKPDDDPTRLCA